MINKKLREGSVFWDYVDTSDDIFVEVDNLFNVVDCNLAFCVLNQHQRVELIGKSVLDSIVGRDRDRVNDILVGAFVGQRKKKASVVKLQQVGGKILKMEMSFNLIVDNSNSIKGLFIRFVEINKNIKNSQSNILLETIYQSLDDIYIIITTNNNNEINHVNNSVVNLLKYSKSDLLGAKLSDICNNDKDTSSNLRNINNKLREGKKGTGKLYIKSKDSKIIPFYVSICPLFYEKKIIGKLGIGKDLSKLEELEKRNKSYAIQLENQSKLAEFGKMMQGVAHNINTPLTGIKSSSQLQKAKLTKFSKLVSDRYGTDEKVEQIFESLIKSTEMINASSGKLSNIVQNMMSKVRQEQNMDMEKLNISNILDQELKFMMANMFFKHKVDKLFDLKRGLPEINGLYSDFSQSFTNIIKNALDAMYSSEVKELSISTNNDEEYIYVIIQDTGCGIPASLQKKIFEPFFTTKPKIDDAKKGEPTGTGIGLDSVKSLLAPYKVKIKVDSKEGRGSKFTFMIPIKDNQRELIIKKTKSS